MSSEISQIVMVSMNVKKGGFKTVPRTPDVSLHGGLLFPAVYKALLHVPDILCARPFHG